MILKDGVAVDIALVKLEIQSVLIMFFGMLLVVTARSTADFSAKQANGVLPCLPTLIAFVMTQLMEIFGVYRHLGQVKSGAYLFHHFLFFIYDDHLITEFF